MVKIYISSLQLQNCGHGNEGMWEIARKHESYEATEIVLKEVLATLRLDFTDRYAVKEMAVFMFLYLGNNSYNFLSCYQNTRPRILFFPILSQFKQLKKEINLIGETLGKTWFVVWWFHVTNKMFISKMLKSNNMICWKSSKRF